MSDILQIGAKEIALKALRASRDWGTTILVWGIVAEIFFEAIWLERSSATNLLREPKPSWPFKEWHFPLLSAKGFAIFLAGAVAVYGLYREQTYGGEVDDTSDQIRSEQQTLIIDAEQRATNAEHDADTSNELASNALKTAADATGRAIRLLRIEANRQLTDD